MSNSQHTPRPPRYKLALLTWVGAYAVITLILQHAHLRNQRIDGRRADMAGHPNHDAALPRMADPRYPRDSSTLR